MEEFTISPPLLNSANPWATTQEDLRALYECPYTGAVTVRTSLLNGFPHDPSIHQYTFFSSSAGHATVEPGPDGRVPSSQIREGETSSLNTLGYSPILFDEYLKMVKEIVETSKLASSREKAKPFLVSVTGTADEVAECYRRMARLIAADEKEKDGKSQLSLMMEVNLSCPNIPDKEPPAYNGDSLTEYIIAIGAARKEVLATIGIALHVGIKTPPYTYQGQYNTLIRALEGIPSSSDSESISEYPISFITATNTLGSCLVLNSGSSSSFNNNDEGNNDHEVVPAPALASANGSGIGGVAGDAIHFLSLGNVRTIRSMLDASKQARLNRIAVIGVGGVSSTSACRRMRAVGATAVAVGTALGREGIPVFERLSLGLSDPDLSQSIS